MTEEKTIFVDGLRVSKPSEKAPDFIKLKFGAKVEDFIKFLQDNKDERGWVNFDLMKSKQGNLYLKLDTFRSKSKEVAGQTYDLPEEDAVDINAQAQIAAQDEREF